MKILIFGGSFNPPTLAHKTIIAECLQLPGFDQVWIMPSGNRTDKHIATPSHHRLKMLEILKTKHFNNSPQLLVSDFELGLPQPNSTHATLLKLQAKHPTTDFWFALGGDAFRSMPSWPNGQLLQTSLRCVVFTNQSIASVHTITLPHGVNNISSTQARTAKNNLLSFVSPPIAAYIAKHNLYQ